MFVKRPLLKIVDPKTVFTIVILGLIFWIFARPLQGIGKGMYRQSGAYISYLANSIFNIKSEISDFFITKETVKKQSEQIASLKLKVNYLESLADKNHQIVEIKNKFFFKTIPANVIGRSIDSWHKQIIIDKGLDKKIMLGDSVISKNGVVGQIAELNKNFSIVRLISDPGFKLGGRIEQKNILGVLSGQSYNTARLEFIPVGTDIKVGDLIKTSGIKSINSLLTYPSGFPIGKVSKVSRKKNKASDLYIEVRLFEDLTTLSEVLIFSAG